MKKNIFYIPFLVILMIIVFPLAIYGLYYNKFKKTDTVLSNIIHITDTITYNCLTNACSYYNGASDSINDNYVLIQDGNIKLYDINNQIIVKEFNNILNMYIDQKLIIGSDNTNKYGVFDITKLEYIINAEYDDIYIINDNYENFIVYKDAYYVVNNNEIISPSINSKIIDYNDNYYVDENNYVYAKNGLLISDNSLNKIVLYNNVLVGYINDVFHIYKDGILEREYSNYSNVTYESNDQELFIYDENGNLIEEYLFN